MDLEHQPPLPQCSEPPSKVAKSLGRTEIQESDGCKASNMKRVHLSWEPATELWRKVSRHPRSKSCPKSRQTSAHFPSPKHLPIIQRFSSTSGVPRAYLKQKNVGSTRKLLFFLFLFVWVSVLLSLCSSLKLQLPCPPRGLTQWGPRASPASGPTTPRSLPHLLSAPIVSSTHHLPGAITYQHIPFNKATASPHLGTPEL